MKKAILLVAIAVAWGTFSFGDFPGSPIGGGGGGGTINVTGTADNQALLWNNSTKVWFAGAVTSASGGDVAGPASSDNAYFAYFNGATGKLLMNGQSSVNPAFSTINVYGANALNLGTGSSIAGSVRFKNATNGNYFQIGGGVAGANIGWTLPTAAPVGNGYLVTASTAGVLTYTDPSTIGGSGSVSDNAYNATNWDGVTTVAPSMNAVRDKIETMGTITGATASRGLVATTTTLGLIETCNTNEILKWSGSLWACAADAQSAGSNPAFDNVTTGTNATALHVGTGGSLNATGSGTITATALSAQYVDWNQSSGATSVANRPTINGSAVTGARLDNAANYPALPYAPSSSTSTATDWNKWDGGATGLTAATGRTSLGLSSSDSPTFAGLTLNGPLVSGTADNTHSGNVMNTSSPTTTNLAAGNYWTLKDETLRLRNQDNSATNILASATKYYKVTIDAPTTADNVVIDGPIPFAQVWDNVLIIVQDNTGKLSGTAADNVTVNLSYCSSIATPTCTNVFTTDQLATGAAILTPALNNTAPSAADYIRVTVSAANMANKKVYIRARYFER